ncbi:MAG: HD domain-containing protein [Patescibacteria group bacterium]
MKLTLANIKKSPQVKAYIEQTDRAFKGQGYTDHGFRHANLVADRASSIARKVGLAKREQELCAIAGYVHDIGNFIGRMYHQKYGAILFLQLFNKEKANLKDTMAITEAIIAHDHHEVWIPSKIGAVVILADKSDVHWSRVIEKEAKNLETDIHDRVNFSVSKNDLYVYPQKKVIELKIKINTKMTDVAEYFEIFTGRMHYVRQAAEYLGYKFSLVINNSKLA